MWTSSRGRPRDTDCTNLSPSALGRLDKGAAPRLKVFEIVKYS